MSVIRTSNVWVDLTSNTRLENLSISISFSKMLNHDKKRLFEQRGQSGRKELLHHSLHEHFSKCNDCFRRCIKQREKRVNSKVWLMCFLVVSLFLSKVSALQERKRVIVEPSSRIKTVSSTHSFTSRLSSGYPIVTAEYFERPFDKDVNRLIDRSEDIIKIQDEEESKEKHIEHTKENLFDTRRPTNSRSQSMLMFWKKKLPWNLYSRQLKSMSNAINRCRFWKKKNLCLPLIAHNYFNI